VTDRDPPQILIAMVRSAAIDVRVMLQRSPEEERTQAAGVLVNFRSGEIHFRRLTDANGHAHLGGIPPGKWSVSIAGETLPAGYRPESEARELVLVAGEVASADIVCELARREIRMQSPLAVR
jgi:hypothetical protein